MIVVYPFGELRVHHEVVNVFFGPSQLQFPGDDGHEQRRAASTLQHWINPQSTLFWLGGHTVDGDTGTELKVLTMMPVVTAIPLPQYVLGTMSPYPTLRNVMAISHMVLSRLACSSSWYLHRSDRHVYTGRG